ncbi:MAG: hypothetical protein IT428_10205 [Planctomycetaceae bacterium]|nr:hypothetical protein [Planctomycetaceae bacterium]
MSTDLTLEERVTAVEKAVAEIQRRSNPLPVSPDWIENFKGAFRDDEDFAEVIRLGREFRLSDRPTDEEDQKPSP